MAALLKRILKRRPVPIPLVIGQRVVVRGSTYSCNIEGKKGTITHVWNEWGGEVTLDTPAYVDRTDAWDIRAHEVKPIIRIRAGEHLVLPRGDV